MTAYAEALLRAAGQTVPGEAAVVTAEPRPRSRFEEDRADDDGLNELSVATEAAPGPASAPATGSTPVAAAQTGQGEPDRPPGRRGEPPPDGSGETPWGEPDETPWGPPNQTRWGRSEMTPGGRKPRDVEPPPRTEARPPAGAEAAAPGPVHATPAAPPRDEARHEVHTVVYREPVPTDEPVATPRTERVVIERPMPADTVTPRDPAPAIEVLRAVPVRAEAELPLPAADPPAPVVVEIGRIEVRLTTSPPSTPAPRERRPRPGPRLSDYLAGGPPR